MTCHAHVVWLWHLGDRVSVQSFPQGLNNLSICGRYYVLYSTFASSSPYLTRDKIWHKLAKSRIRYPRFQVCQTNRFGKYSCAPNLLRVRVAKIHLSGYASPVPAQQGRMAGLQEIYRFPPWNSPENFVVAGTWKKSPLGPSEKEIHLPNLPFCGFKMLFLCHHLLPVFWYCRMSEPLRIHVETTPRCCILDQTCRPKCSM